MAEEMTTSLSSDCGCDAVKLLQLLAQQIFQPEEIGKSLVGVHWLIIIIKYYN